jgi:MAX-like protein X
MIMANTVVIRPVNLPVKTNDGSISGGLTFDKQNTSLKNLIYYIKHAYSSNLTSPKWKNFKGIKLQVTEKIRLNNVIWRTWFEQYGIRDVSKRKKSLICQFTNVLETTKPPKVTVLEGKYWKRRLESITTEYKKWRELSRKQIKSINDTQSILSEQLILDKVAQITNNFSNNNNNLNNSNNNNNNNYQLLNNENNLNNNSICIANNNSNNSNQQLNQLINNNSMYDNNNLQINVQTPIANSNSFYLSNANSLS